VIPANPCVAANLRQPVENDARSQGPPIPLSTTSSGCSPIASNLVAWAARWRRSALFTETGSARSRSPADDFGGSKVDLAGCVGQRPPYMHGTVHVVPAERQHFLASEPSPSARWTATSHGTSPWTASRIPIAFGAPITSNVGLSPTEQFTSCAEAAHRPARLAELVRPQERTAGTALTEQARSGLGMNEVRVAAPGAGVRRTLVEAKRVNGGETDFFLWGTDPRSCVP